MVTKKARDNRKYFNESMKIFGRKDITLTNLSITLGPSGSPTSITETSSTIEGDLQYGDELDKNLLDEGELQSGEGMFYCRYSYTINPEDYITVDSVKWTIARVFRKPRLGDSIIHQEFVVRRRESND